MKAPVKVSVAMIAYNHERLVAQALESVLMQRVDFPYEIVVSDDHSIDGTAAIIADFHRRYPDKIVPFLRQRNLGVVPNFMETIAACRGQYVALLEGDDYWLDERKLQRQVDFLDAHPDFAISCHRVKVLDGTGAGGDNHFPPRHAGAYTLTDLLALNFIMTCTVVYRREAAPRLPARFRSMKLGDWPLMAMVARSGKIDLMDDTLAAYRVHPGGSWSSTSEIKRLHETIRMLIALDAELGSNYRSVIRHSIALFSFSLAKAARKERERLETGWALLQCLRNGGWRLPGEHRVIANLAAFVLLGSRRNVPRELPDTNSNTL